MQRVAVILSSMMFPFLAAAADSRPQFDVASVKVDKSETGVDRVKNEPGSLILINVSLRRIIAMAYGIPEGQDNLFSGPEWLDSADYDISAKYPPETSNADFLRMFQGLLEERFALKVHRETRPFTAYALTIAKGGPKLKQTQPGAYRFRAQNGTAEGYRISMPMLAARFSRPDFKLDRQVVDLTGLTGVYDLKLTWSPEPGLSDDQPSLFTALEEQLGLKLELRKNMPLEVLVVDHADRVPVEN